VPPTPGRSLQAVGASRFPETAATPAPVSLFGGWGPSGFMFGRFRPIVWPLQSERLEMRLPRPSDATEVAAAISDPRIARATLHIPYPYRQADAARWIARSRRHRVAGTSLSVLLFERPTDRIVGGVSLFGFDWERSKAEIGYWVTPSAWGQGYAPEAVHRVARVAFQALKLHRLEAGTFEFNSASGRVLEKTGFVREGLARGDVRKSGKWHNTVVYGLLRTDLRRPVPARDRPASN
jgi:[ribosomal protein S5]-alanine N-acetyltransferase